MRSRRKQIDNEMGTARYSLFFKPGTYGTAAAPLKFQVGYYTEVAGLGQEPDRRHDQRQRRRLQPVHHRRPTASRLNNFWRSLSNLTVNV